MKKTQSRSLSGMKTGYPYNYGYVKSFGGYLNTDSFFEGPVIDRRKHKDFDTTEGNVITQIFMKEYTHTCPCCGKSEVIKRDFILFYTKDSIIHNFWKNVKPYTL